MGWLGLNPDHSKKIPKNKVFISMIIPFRNEESNLPVLLDCIKAIQYPKHLFEVIFVNDHSTDKSLALVNNALLGLPNCKILNNSSNIHGKKGSLKLGIESTQGELLLFTDADCIFSPNRLNEYARFYVQNNNPDMIIGLVDYMGENKVLSKIIRLEFLSLMLSGAGMSGRGNPVFCNGANLGVKRSIFNEELDLKEEIASGDDVFLLHSLKYKQKRIKLIKTRESLVYTKPPKGLKDFFTQRRRWGAKSINYTDRDTIILALVVSATNVFIPVAFVVSLLTKEYFLFLFSIGAKLSIDILLFITGIRFFKIGFSVFMVPFLEIIYPFYISITAIAGIIKKPFHWKGRLSRT